MNQQISQDPLENLLTSSLVKIEQHLEPLEIVTGFETRNRFSIIGNNFVLFGREDSPVISRMFVPNWRAFTFNISDGEGSVWLSLRKPFDILFAKVVVSDRYGQPIGLVRTRLSIIAKRLDILDENLTVCATLRSTALHPWTFNIQVNGSPAGVLTRRWGGLARETFTDANNFTLELYPSLSMTMRKLLLAAAFLIDFNWYERKK